MFSARRISSSWASRSIPLISVALLAFTYPVVARAAEAHSQFDGSELGLAWIIPFIGILISIALLPLITPRFWEHRFGAVSAFWACALLAPMAVAFGPDVTWNALLHTLLLEYLPFIILLFALFVVAGGINISGNLVGTPSTNVAILTVGTLLASVIGTTGASMVLIRPMIRANAARRRKVHVFIFFIFLVSNIGGSLTPLGDPPLFLGFLKGVDFFWTFEHMLLPMLMMAGALLAIFYVFDLLSWRHEKGLHDTRAQHQLRVVGLHNILYLFGILAAVLASGTWNSGISVNVYDMELGLEGLGRDVVLLVISYFSYKSTRPSIRIENAFTWKPIQEVAILFAGIFVTMVPALAILRAGTAGVAAPLAEFVTSPSGQPINAAYFWVTGALSSFLDNAPTYLVFFNLAGGVPESLMGPLANTLLAISAGAVFMGANSYIGNAPNFMVKSICEERGIRMPSFFGYMIWSGTILLPLFLAVTWIFF